MKSQFVKVLKRHKAGTTEVPPDHTLKFNEGKVEYLIYNGRKTHSVFVKHGAGYKNGYLG
jgi:hypothetical protein